VGAGLSTAAFREASKLLGVDALGWFSATGFPQYLAVLEERREYHRIEYRTLEQFRAAARMPDWVVTVLVLVRDYFVGNEYAAGEYKLSNYSRACWQTVGPVTNRMLQFLREKGVRAEQLNVPCRAAACRAGLGFIGRNGMFYAMDIGSYVGIAVIGVDVTIPEAGQGAERVLHPQCSTCGRCAEACPTGAIIQEGHGIYPLRCISFLNRHPDEPSCQMPADPAALCGWLHGCEVCQNVCPLNTVIVHRPTPVSTPELDLYGMRVPNQASVSRAEIECRMSRVTSPGFREYLARLLSTAVPRG